MTGSVDDGDGSFEMQKNKDGGYIVVETIGAFIPFLLLVISILSLVNIVTLQARMHYALTQAANTISMYSYALDVMGFTDDLKKLNAEAGIVAREANEMRSDINKVLSGIQGLANLSGALEHGESAAGRAYGWGEEAAADPARVLQLLASYGLEEVRSQLFEELARPLVGRYLGNGAMSGDDYLSSVRVVRSDRGRVASSGLDALEFHRWEGLGWGNSVLIDRDGNIKLTVHYEVEYVFGGLRLPFSPTLKITQTAVTKAWLSGSGRGYW